MKYDLDELVYYLDYCKEMEKLLHHTNYGKYVLFRCTAGLCELSKGIPEPFSPMTKYSGIYIFLYNQLPWWKKLQFWFFPRAYWWKANDLCPRRAFIAKIIGRLQVEIKKRKSHPYK